MRVFPTGVGMNRELIDSFIYSQSVPHRRGDEPKINFAEMFIALCSPQAWG